MDQFVKDGLLILEELSMLKDDKWLLMRCLGCGQRVIGEVDGRRYCLELRYFYFRLFVLKEEYCWMIVSIGWEQWRELIEASCEV